MSGIKNWSRVKTTSMNTSEDWTKTQYMDLTTPSPIVQRRRTRQKVKEQLKNTTPIKTSDSKKNTEEANKTLRV